MLPIDKNLRATIFETLLMLFDLSGDTPVNNIRNAWKEALWKQQKLDKGVNIVDYIYPARAPQVDTNR